MIVLLNCESSHLSKQPNFGIFFLPLRNIFSGSKCNQGLWNSICWWDFCSGLVLLYNQNRTCTIVLKSFSLSISQWWNAFSLRRQATWWVTSLLLWFWVLVSFVVNTSESHFERRELQLRECSHQAGLWLSLEDIYFKLKFDMGGPSLLWVSWSGGSGWCERADWASRGLQVSQQILHGLCFRSCFQVPTLSFRSDFFDAGLWYGSVAVQIFSSPGCFWLWCGFFFTEREILSICVLW